MAVLDPAIHRELRQGVSMDGRFKGGHDE